jgi:ketosteroid isomerase-like protein
VAEDKLDVVKAGIASWEGSDDFTAALLSFDEEVVLRRVSPLPDPGTWTGREGLLELIADWMEDLDDFQMRAEEYLDGGGDIVIVRVVQEGRGAISGAPVEATFWFVYEVRESKVIRLDMYGDKADAYEAEGLSP